MVKLRESTSGQDTVASENITTAGALTAYDLGRKVIVNHPEWGPISGILRHVSHSKLTGSSIMMDRPDAQLTLRHEVIIHYAEEA